MIYKNKNTEKDNNITIKKNKINHYTGNDKIHKEY